MSSQAPAASNPTAGSTATGNVNAGTAGAAAHAPAPTAGAAAHAPAPAAGAATGAAAGPKTFKQLLMEWGVDDVTSNAVIAQGIDSTMSLIRGNDKFIENVLKHMRHFPPTLGTGQKIFIPYQFQRNLEIMQFGVKL